MKTKFEFVVVAAIVGQLAIAAPVFAAEPAPFVTLPTLVIVGKRPAPDATAKASTKAVNEEKHLVANLETMNIVGHRSVILSQNLRLARAQSAATLPHASAL